MTGHQPLCPCGSAPLIPFIPNDIGLARPVHVILFTCRTIIVPVGTIPCLYFLEHSMASKENQPKTTVFIFAKDLKKAVIYGLDPNF
jgi:hypothetical protein